MARMRAERLEDLIRDRVLFLYVICRGCGHVARFVVTDLVKFYGRGRLVKAMRFRCAGCGERRFDVMPKDPRGEREIPRPVAGSDG